MKSEDRGPRLLLINDDAASNALICTVAKAQGFRVTVLTSVELFLEKLRCDIKLIVIELMMPKIDGIELLRLLAFRKSAAPVVLMSGTLDMQILQSAGEVAKAMGLRVAGLLNKPLQFSAVYTMLKQHLQKSPVLAVKHVDSLSYTDQELRSAVERDEFELHYQPQIDLETGRVSGVEALVRWRSPQGVLIFPDRFIARAEALNLITELDWLVARRAFSEFQQLHHENVQIPSLSLNVSPHSLCDLLLPEKLMHLGEECGIALERVVLEITESGSVANLPRSLDVLTRLRMKHVRLSLDDFGIGSSTFKQLRMVPATDLKIDKSFVQQMLQQEYDCILVVKTIEIGHAFGLRVVAEGVETRDQLRFLRHQRCDRAQGFLFSVPIPAESLVGWIKAHRPAAFRRPQ